MPIYLIEVPAKTIKNKNQHNLADLGMICPFTVQRSQNPRYHADMETIGALIKKRRREVGVTQGQLADLSGVAERSIYGIEHGKGTVRLDRLTAVLDALGLKIALVDRKEKTYRPS